MNYILHYFNLCVLCNIFMSIWFLILAYSENITKNIITGLQVISFFGIAKIIIQINITRRIRKELSYTKELNFDRLFDLIKVGYYTYVFIIFDKFFNNVKMYIVASIIGINYFVIFLQMIYNLLSPETFRDTIRTPLIYTSQPEVSISFSNQLNVYSVLHNTNVICPICLDEQFKSENWTKLRYEHDFHHKCITDWFNKKRNCPTCRIDI